MEPTEGTLVTERPALRGISGREDPVLRRRRFEQDHPDVTIMPPVGGRWRAIVPPGRFPDDDTRTTLGAWDLESLMTQLEELYEP